MASGFPRAYVAWPRTRDDSQSQPGHEGCRQGGDRRHAGTHVFFGERDQHPGSAHRRRTHRLHRRMGPRLALGLPHAVVGFIYSEAFPGRSSCRERGGLTMPGKILQEIRGGRLSPPLLCETVRAMGAGLSAVLKANLGECNGFIRNGDVVWIHGKYEGKPHEKPGTSAILVPSGPEAHRCRPSGRPGRWRSATTSYILIP